MRRKLFTIFMTVCLGVICPQFGMFVTVRAAPANFPVDVLLDYGNGTRTWSTSILSTPDYDTAFNATQIAADTLNYTVYSSGIFVDAINGVWNNRTSGHWWALFFWNFTSGSWEPSPVGADQLVLSDGDIIAWYYDVHPWPPLPPANPPVTQVDVLLDYGNGTAKWYENVNVIGVATVFKATKSVATLIYSLWGDDVFVDAINGVWNNFTTNYYWLYWYWNSTSGSWNCGPVACNKYFLNNGDVIAWYSETDPWGPPPHDQLTVTSSPITGIAFTIDGVPQTTPYTDWLVEDSYTLEMPETYNGYVWSHWLEDGDTNRIKTITLPGTTWTAVYTSAPPPVGGISAPIKVPLSVDKLNPVSPWLWLMPVVAFLIFVIVLAKHKKKEVNILPSNTLRPRCRYVSKHS